LLLDIVFNGFNGLIVGSFYALMAIGLSLILGLNGVINFAHGGFMALAAYLAFTLVPYVGFWGALAIAPVLAGGVGFIVEKLIIQRLYTRDPLYSLLATFGLALIIQDMLRTIWGAQGLPLAIPDFLNQPVSNTYFFVTGCLWSHLPSSPPAGCSRFCATQGLACASAPAMRTLRPSRLSV